MTEAQYDPPEAKIAEVIAKTSGDPRKLAIAYLRAQRRWRASEFMLEVTSDLDASLVAVMRGDVKGATEALQRGKRRVSTFNQMTEDQ